MIIRNRFKELDELNYFIGEKDSKESERLLKDCPNKTYLLRYSPTPARQGYWVAYKDNDVVYQIPVIHPAHVTEDIQFTLMRGSFKDIDQAKPYNPKAEKESKKENTKTEPSNNPATLFSTDKQGVKEKSDVSKVDKSYSVFEPD